MEELMDEWIDEHMTTQMEIPLLQIGHDSKFESGTDSCTYITCTVWEWGHDDYSILTLLISCWSFSVTNELFKITHNKLVRETTSKL